MFLGKEKQYKEIKIKFKLILIYYYQSIHINLNKKNKNWLVFLKYQRNISYFFIINKSSYSILNLMFDIFR